MIFMTYKKKLLKEHFDSLSEKERLLLCRKAINSCISSLNTKEKAVLSEFNHSNGSYKRTAHNRGGKATTLTARAIASTQIYFSCIEHLKEVVKLL